MDLGVLGTGGWASPAQQGVPPGVALRSASACEDATAQPARLASPGLVVVDPALSYSRSFLTKLHISSRNGLDLVLLS